jgi:hypothetical protein
MESKEGVEMSSDVIEWLLEKENPSVRYFTLTTLLDHPADDPLVMQAKEDIMLDGLVPKILSKQNEDGSWSIPERFYTDKYKGTVWVVLMLAELGAEPKDPQVRKGCEFILAHSQCPENGGFSHMQSAKTTQGLPNGVIPCLSGNMIYALIKLGYLEDARVQSGIAWITKYQRADDGDKIRSKDEPYSRLITCFGKHSCHMGAAKALKGLAAIPEDKLTVDAKAKRDELVEYFLIHHIHKKSHQIDQISRPGWLKFGFPLMYQADVLELSDIMADLKIRDSRLSEAIQTIRDKQDKDGKWNLENSFNGKTIVSVEKKGFPSKWITLKALRVLKSYDKEISIEHLF